MTSTDRMPSARRGGAVPRALHPLAWWLWALGLATAASRTTNPVLLALVLVVVGHVVVARRTDAPWARAFHAALVLAGAVLVFRLVFEAVFGTVDGPTTLLTLPTLPVPDWAAGVVVGGPVTLEGLAIGLAEALQIATIIVCVGAANALAAPTRLLRSVPGALYEVGVAVVVGLTTIPQAVDSVRRLRRAQRLRGRSTRGVRALVAIAAPVLANSLERSLELAASMDSRGYGRRSEVSAPTRLATTAVLLLGLVAVLCSSYGLLSAGTPSLFGVPLLLGGVALCALGLGLAGRRTVRTRYRPDRWLAAEWVTVAAGAVPAAGLVLAASVGTAGLGGPTIPLTLPTVPLGVVAALLAGVLPAYLTPVQQVAPRRPDRPADLADLADRLAPGVAA